MMFVRQDIITPYIFLNDTSDDNPHALPWMVDYAHAERLPVLVEVYD